MTDQLPAGLPEPDEGQARATGGVLCHYVASSPGEALRFARWIEHHLGDLDVGAVRAYLGLVHDRLAPECGDPATTDLRPERRAPMPRGKLAEALWQMAEDLASELQVDGPVPFTAGPGAALAYLREASLRLGHSPADVRITADTSQARAAISEALALALGEDAEIIAAGLADAEAGGLTSLQRDEAARQASGGTWARQPDPALSGVLDDPRLAALADADPAGVMPVASWWQQEHPGSIASGIWTPGTGPEDPPHLDGEAPPFEVVQCAAHPDDCPNGPEAHAYHPPEVPGLPCCIQPGEEPGR